MKRIIAAVDDGESALQVARFAVELASGLGTDLVLVTVARHIDEGEQPDLDRYRREEHVQESLAVLSVDAARFRLTSLRGQLDNAPGIEITCDVLSGNVAEQLVSYARLHAVDLIVIGHRSRNRLAGLLVGSVAKHVIDTAPCPVLVVR
jgi:nucleotide-binding universal stress UspA family protein